MTDFIEGEIAANFLAAMVAQPKVKRLLLSEHFSVDATLLEAWASLKSFRRQDGGDNDKDGSGHTAERGFHKEKRSNETHRSSTDPEAWLYKKGEGQPAKLCYLDHTLIENHHGLVVGGGATLATGTAKREAALALVDGTRRSRRRVTLSADKGLQGPVGHTARRHKRTPEAARCLVVRRTKQVRTDQEGNLAGSL